MVVGWVRDRVRVRARARECISTFFSSGLAKCDEHLCFGSLI